MVYFTCNRIDAVCVSYGICVWYLLVSLVSEEGSVTPSDARPLGVDEDLSRSQGNERPVNMHGILVLLVGCVLSVTHISLKVGLGRP